ncbi:DMT family transporter [Leuconostoc suionicum]|uniref:DMT family transporter n=1 Tax=Leuconostoc suionicum TaxID=1511761 RepID=UPI001B8AF4D0|nr:DMT family transporter [Leuconostoc suionicum]MBS1008776.1 DMT family transporter [Leuconostoc suionicum]
MPLFILGLVIGFGLPIQTAVNSKLRSVLGSAFNSSLVSFGVGTIFLTAVTLVTTHSLMINGSFFSTEPWWIWIGGALGVIYLTGNIVLFPKLGSVQTVIMPILGQIVMSMLIDNFGWFYSKQHDFTWFRGVGALLVLAGVFLSVSLTQLVLKQKNSPKAVASQNNESNYIRLSWQFLGFLTGMLSALQTAINGHLGKVINSSLKAALISFLVGFITLLIIVLINHYAHKPKQAIQLVQQPWWIWIGGIIGSLFVLGNIFLVPLLGTGLVVVIVLVGQIAGSLLVDQFGWFGAKKNPISAIQLLGLLFMVGGVVLIKFF